MARTSGRSAADTRRLILDAAARFFARKGFGDASMRDIAGISSANGRVVGLMPHPEHATEALTGPSDDGLGIFYSALDAILVS